jgi:hypothetical protein
MNIWGKIWKVISFVLAGFILGMIAAIKFIAPPGEDIEVNFDKVKFVIRGKNNQVTDGLDVTPIVNITKEKSKRQKKKEEREKKRAERKNK